MRVLVVEDDKKVASFVEKGLREDGYSVDVAHNGAEGSMKAHVNDYDLLILDLMLPGRTGTEIIRELRREGCRSGTPPDGSGRHGGHRQGAWTPVLTTTSRSPSASRSFWPACGRSYAGAELSDWTRLTYAGY